MSTEIGLLQKIVDSSLDCFYEVVQFLTPRDCCNVEETNMSFFDLMQSDIIWRERSLNVFAHANVVKGIPQLSNLKTLLCIPSYKTMFANFRHLKFNIFGWFRCTEASIDYYVGALYLIRILDNKLLVQRVETDGKLCTDPGRNFYLLYVNTLKRFKAISINEEHDYDILITKTILFTSTLNGSIGKEFKKINPIPSIQTNLTTPGTTSTDNFEVSNIAEGLFTGCYGSHGNEILWVSIKEGNERLLPQIGMFNNGRDSGQGRELQGLKVTGDRNVPCGKISFCIDLNRVTDFERELELDHRPIAVISDRLELMELSVRRSNILTWARGVGQINRFPGRWEPEWITCSCVIYRDPSLVGGVHFSLIWDDPSERMIRHAIEFKTLTTVDVPSWKDDISNGLF